ncbi:MAG TPA: hypothetical protein VK066_05735 [Chloroflexota bacterium]|nr:hypothetical protein [Chloroflexota bacterium]
MSRASARAVASPQIVGPRLAVAALLFTPLLGWLFQAWSGVSPALAAPLADAPSTYEAEPQPDDASPGADRYQFQVRPGASLWDIAHEALPGVVLEDGDQRAVDLITEAFQDANPGRAPNDVRLGDTFVLEVPAGTFVTQSLSTPDRGRTVEYVSFQGDTLTHFRADPALVYRQVSASDPSRARVLLRAGTSVPAADVAKRVFQVDPPDFIQVRTVRGALTENPPAIDVNLDQPYLDLFRNYRDQAVSVEPGDEGMQVYHFDPDDDSVPFLAVEDAIGDEWEPGNFPRIARREFYRDGTVKRYILTQPGDLLAALVKPDNKRWATLLPSWSSWTDGQAQQLKPFAPAVNEVGSLLPGRILVLVHQPKPDPGKSAECLGIPVALAVSAGALGEWWRRRHRDEFVED